MTIYRKLECEQLDVLVWDRSTSGTIDELYTIYIILMSFDSHIGAIPWCIMG